MSNRTKEAYREFLKTPFWIELTAKKKSLIGKCERCGSTDRLESHHKLYRACWFQTILEDLEVLCRDCHQSHHDGLKKRRKAPGAKKQKREVYHHPGRLSRRARKWLAKQFRKGRTPQRRGDYIKIRKAWVHFPLK